MAAQKIGSEVILLAVFFLYGLIYYKRNYLLAMCTIAVAAYLTTQSLHVVIGVLIGSFILHQFNAIMTPPKAEPVGYNIHEGFQAKDPISIHQRIADAKKEQEKPSSITGVLESPDILDNLQIAKAEGGSARKGGPAGLAAGQQPIHTPPQLEDQLPAEGSYENRVPKANPPLQNGPDNQGVMTALVPKGTGLMSGQPAAQVAAAV